MYKIPKMSIIASLNVPCEYHTRAFVLVLYFTIYSRGLDCYPKYIEDHSSVFVDWLIWINLVNFLSCFVEYSSIELIPKHCVNANISSNAIRLDGFSEMCNWVLNLKHWISINYHLLWWISFYKVSYWNTKVHGKKKEKSSIFLSICLVFSVL